MVGKPNFAIELSNDLVRLLHRAVGDIWVPIEEIETSDSNFDDAIETMRKQVRTVPGIIPNVVVVLPETEIKFSSAAVGAFRGDAAKKRAHIVLAEEIGLRADEISCFLSGDIKDGQMSAAVVTLQTLQEAKDYATKLGFNPSFFSARWRRHNFPTEPIFTLPADTKKRVPIFAIAACLIGVIGISLYAGFSNENAEPSIDQTQVSNDLVIDAETFELTKSLQETDITNNAELVAPLSPNEGALEEPVQVAETILASAVKPKIRTPIVKSRQEITNSVPAAAKTSLATDVRVASISASGNLWDANSSDTVLLDTKETSIQIASLEATVTGTPSPEGFTLYKGKPPVSPPLRETNKNIQVDETSTRQGLRPKYRPFANTTEAVPETQETATKEAPLDITEDAPTNTPVSETPVEAVNSILPTVSQPTNDENTQVTTTKDPDLFRPKSRPATLTPETITEVALLQEQQASLVKEDVELPLAGDEAKAEKPKEIDPVLGSAESALEELEDAVDLLAVANPDLAKFRPKYRISTPDENTTDPVQEDSLLALASPALKGKRPKTRPEKLSSIVKPKLSTLDLASPALRGKKPKRRPAFKVARVEPVPTDPKPAPQITPELTEAQKALEAEIKAERQRQVNLATSTRLAIRKSPRPPQKSKNFGRISERTLKEKRRLASAPATQKAPKAVTKPSSTTTSKPERTSSTFSKGKLSLVGVYGSRSKRRVLFRTSGGRYVKAKSGERVAGWKVTAIGESSVKITRGSKARTLRISR